MTCTALVRVNGLMANRCPGSNAGRVARRKYRLRASITPRTTPRCADTGLVLAETAPIRGRGNLILSRGNAPFVRVDASPRLLSSSASTSSPSSFLFPSSSSHRPVFSSAVSRLRLRPFPPRGRPRIRRGADSASIYSNERQPRPSDPSRRTGRSRVASSVFLAHSLASARKEDLRKWQGRGVHERRTSGSRVNVVPHAEVDPRVPPILRVFEDDRRNRFSRLRRLLAK